MKRALILLALISPISCDSLEQGDPRKMQITGQIKRGLQDAVDDDDKKYGEFHGKRWVRKFDMTS